MGGRQRVRAAHLVSSQCDWPLSHHPTHASIHTPTPRLQAIPAFEEAVAGMRVGGVRRVEVLGEIPALSYPRDRSERFVSGFK